jgi:hypothetical protein
MKNSQLTDRLAGHIVNMPPKFTGLPEKQRLSPPAPGKWSPQEILGHLVDSAINNLKRFTEIQFLPQPYTVIRYQQDNLVLVNHYQQLPAEHLLALWQQLNRQIVYVIDEISSEKLAYTVIIPSGESKTLEWLIVDYVDHMEHHLRQIFGADLT